MVWRRVGRARVAASVEGDHTIRATTANVGALSFEMGVGAELLNPAVKAAVTIDVQTLAVPGAMSDGSWTVHLRKTGGKWTVGEDESKTVKKRHDLQGPIDDAFWGFF